MPYLWPPKLPPLGLLPPIFLLPPKEPLLGLLKVPLDLPKELPLGLLKVPNDLFVPMLLLLVLGVLVELLGTMLVDPFPNRLLPLLGLTFGL